MSLLNITSFAIPTLLLQGALDISFWTTKEQATHGNHSMHLSDEEYKKGNVTGALHHFYNVYCPQVEDEEKQYVAKYVESLSIGVAVTTQAFKSKHHADMQCLVFGICGQAAELTEKRDVESTDSAAYSWVFDLAHRATRMTLEELAFRFATGHMTAHINDYLRGGSPRSYCFNGACLSWHHDILTSWSPQTAAYVVRNVLAVNRAALAISAKTVADYPAGVQAWCVSNRPTGC